MNNGVRPSLSGRFQMSALAPRSASKRTIAGKLPNAAPCIALSPSSSTASTSAAEVEQHLHRFERFGFLAGLLERGVVPTPAAAISGVV